TYAYATLGELFAWIIGWDLVLEYAMACACVASSWSKYLNELLTIVAGVRIPEYLSADPFSTPDAWLNLPALLITLAVTAILVIGIRESATTNAILVAVKVGVVLFVIGAGIGYVSRANWTEVPVADRLLPEEGLIPKEGPEDGEKTEHLSGAAAKKRAEALITAALAEQKVEHHRRVLDQLRREGLPTGEAERVVQATEAKYGPRLPKTETDRKAVEAILAEVRQKAPAKS